MMRLSGAFLGLALVAWAPVASAQLPAKAAPKTATTATTMPAIRDCAYDTIPAEDRARIATGYRATESRDETAQIVSLIHLTVDDCADQHDLDEAKRTALFDYTLGRILRDLVIPELQRKGVNLAKVDRSQNFGKGKKSALERAAPGKEGEAMMQAMTKSGIDYSKLSENEFEALALYLVASSLYWRAFNILG